MKKKISSECWLCNSKELEIAKLSNLDETKQESSFVISGRDYGITGEMHHCQNCDFLQWSDMNDVLPFYENTMEDPTYESLRKGRSLQARKVVEKIIKYKKQGKLLDVGAGSGILVEQAIKTGYKAEGIEPSRWFQEKATELGLPVYLGSLPHSNLRGPYEIVTLIDVIEHVSNPIELLLEIKKITTTNSIIVIITPDRGSIPAKLLGWKWWNYKPGHIGYFNNKTIEFATQKAGLKQIKLCYRPALYYPLGFIAERVKLYLPKFLQFPIPQFFQNLILPLDLKDSLMGIYTLK